MNKIFSIYTVAVILTLFLTACGKDKGHKQQTHTLHHSGTHAYNWTRLRAISKVTNVHSGRMLVVGCEYSIEDPNCDAYNSWDHYNEHIKSFVIKPTVNNYGEPDIDISIVDNNQYLELARRNEHSSIFITNRISTRITYYFTTTDQCKYMLEMEIKRPKRKDSDPSTKLLKSFKYDITPDISNSSFCAQNPVTDPILAKGGRGRD